MVDALVVRHTVGYCDGGEGLLESLEREGGRIGCEHVEGTDGRGKLVVRNFWMKGDALPAKFVALAMVSTKLGIALAPGL